jgi:hypothetical protein
MATKTMQRPTPPVWKRLGQAGLAAGAALLFVWVFAGQSGDRTCLGAGRGAIDCHAESEAPAAPCASLGRGGRICPARPG